MRIGVIGAGSIGRTLGALLRTAGHEVMLSWSSTPDRLAQAAAEVGAGARTGTPEQAVAFADTVLFAPRFEHVTAARDAAGSLADVIGIDTTNPYNPQRDGVVDLDGLTAGQHVAGLLPGARYVKGFNTLTSGFLAEAAGRVGAHQAVVLLCGDDAPAKRVVGGLVRELGFAPVDLGGLAESARQEPGGDLYGEELHVADLPDLTAP